MPIHEFTCQDCGLEFEELVFSADEAIECEDCGSASVKRRLSVFAHKSGDTFVSSSQGSGDSCGSCTSGSCAGCGCH